MLIVRDLINRVNNEDYSCFEPGRDDGDIKYAIISKVTNGTHGVDSGVRKENMVDAMKSYINL